MKKLLLSIALVAMASINTSATFINADIHNVSYKNEVLSSRLLWGYDLVIVLMRFDDPAIRSIDLSQEQSRVWFEAGSDWYWIGENITYFLLDDVTTDSIGSTFHLTKSSDGFWQPLTEGTYTMGLKYSFWDDNEEFRVYYWNLANEVLTLTEEDLSADTINLGDFTFVDKQNRSNVITNGSGWTWDGEPAIPEPATGALALAGVALLFRRRRA